MTNLKIQEHNCETGEIIVRDMTAQELAQYQKDLQTFEQIKAQQVELEAQKTAAKAKLSALGLTVDDLKALGLG